MGFTNLDGEYIMALHPRHEEKKKTNYAIAGVIVFFVVLFFSLTIIKLQQQGQTPEGQMHESKHQSQSTQTDQ